MSELSDIQTYRETLEKSGLKQDSRTDGVQVYHSTDLGNARRLVDHHGHDLRYVSQSGWHVFTGKRWEKDETGEIFRRMKSVVRSIYTEASNTPDKDARKGLAKHATTSESEHKIRAAVNLAKTEPEVATTLNRFDRDPYLLTVNNGTLNLKTGRLQEHLREELITKLAPIHYDPDAPAPMFSEFLNRIMDGNADMIGFLQRSIGYSLTGDTSEQCLFIWHGLGANGKSTLLGLLRAMLGDYARQTPVETLLVSRDQGISNDVARLAGARLVTAVEAGEGRRLSESLVKQMTGGEPLTARFLHREYFEFDPIFKLLMVTNHKPVIRGTDSAIWRRIRLVPFGVAIPPEEQDKRLLDKLKEELPGVLAWAVQGCQEWIKGGLRPPEEIRKATGQYRAEMDVLGDFLSECCVEGSVCYATAKDLYHSYTQWAEENGERALTQKRFGGQLAERGFDSARITSGPGKGRIQWMGIGIKE